MDGYRVEGVIGDGSFGSVLQAVHLQSGDTVAIKRLKRRYASIDDAMRLREVLALRELRHPCIVRLREAVYEEQQLSLVFEHLPLNLHQMLRQRTRPVQPRSLRHIVSAADSRQQRNSLCLCDAHAAASTAPCQMQQLLSALSHLHSRGLFHRDIKPENLLVRTADCDTETETETEAAATVLPVVKLADFGQAKPIRSVPPFTEYVATRWYRAPELLLRSAAYSSPIDVWAAGCVMAELLTLAPLFPGTGEVDMIRRIAACIGPPSASCWPEGAALVAQAGLTFAAAASSSTASLSQRLRARCPAVSDEAVALLSTMLCWDPRRRISARQALQHAYFAAGDGRKEDDSEGSAAEAAVDGAEAELQLLSPASNASMRRTSASAVKLSSSSASVSRPSSVQSSRESAEQRHLRFVHSANAMMH